MKQLPQPAEFGLPENVEEAYLVEKKKYESNSRQLYRKKNQKNYLLALIVPSLIGLAYCIYSEHLPINEVNWLDILGTDLILTFAISGWMVIPDWIFCIGLKSPLSEFMESDFYNRYSKYKKAVEDHHKRKAQKTESFWKNQSGHEFEQEVAKIYRAQGYKAVVSKAGGDGGVDIVLTKGKEEIAVQCKHHNKAVSPAVVRDLYGTMLAQKFNRGILVSLNGFTKGTIDFARGKPIELVDMYQLIRMAESNDS